MTCFVEVRDPLLVESLYQKGSIGLPTAKRGVILWDFEGTLGERPGGWARLLVELLDAEIPEHGFTADVFRPHLQKGFPWHDWQTPHPHWMTAETWWGNLCPILAEAYERAGIGQEQASVLAEAARSRYPDPSRIVLYDDTVPALRRLAERGWRHAILSNHIPELAAIVANSALAEVVNWTISSGISGFEKPHPEAYAHARHIVGEPISWMVGDNPECDVAGARQAGIRALLVRQDDGRTRPFAPDLASAADVILSEEE